MDSGGSGGGALDALPVGPDAASPGVLNPPEVVVQLDTAIETFHDSAGERCGAVDVHIDSPVRTFVDSDSLVHLVTADQNGTAWQWTGSRAQFAGSPTAATRPTLDCTPVMSGLGSGYPNVAPSLFNQKSFLQSLHFDPVAGRVYGLAHTDYWGNRDASNTTCHDQGVADGKPYCWYAAVTLWSALASGTHVTFARVAAPPNHVAVHPFAKYPGDAQSPTAPGWIGPGTPSNIVRGFGPDGRPDGNHYVFVFVSRGFGGQERGACLYRTKDPGSPSSYVGFGGTDFDVPSQNPFTTAPAVPCARVAPDLFVDEVRSLVRYEPLGVYVAFFQAGTVFSYASSIDLVHWSPRKPLLDVASGVGGGVYPSIVDHDADGVSDVIGEGPNVFLYYRKTFSPETRIVRRRITVAPAK